MPFGVRGGSLPMPCSLRGGGGGAWEPPPPHKCKVVPTLASRPQLPLWMGRGESGLASSF